MRATRRHAPRAWAMLAGVGIALTGAAGQNGPQFLVSDDGGNKIVRFDFPSGEAADHFVGTGLTTLAGAGDMTYGPDGNLYIVSGFNNSVLRFHGSSGRFLGVFVTSGSGGLNGASGLAFGPDGHLYVNSGNRVLRYDGANGAFIDIFVQPGAGGLNSARGIAFGSAGHLYVANFNSSSVLRFDGADGTFLDTPVPSGAAGLNGAYGLLFDDTGRLYISGLISNNVVVLPPGGSATLLVPSGSGSLTGPRHMAVDPDGALVVTSVGTVASALRYNRLSGQFLSTLLPSSAGGLGQNRIGLVFMPPPPPECPADFNNDGNLDIFDVIDFLGAFEAGCP